MLDDVALPDHRAADQIHLCAFGTVIETEGATLPINRGTTTRFDALATVDMLAARGGSPLSRCFVAPAARIRSPSACSNATRLARRPSIPLLMLNGWLSLPPAMQTTQPPILPACAVFWPAGRRASAMRAAPGTIRCWYCCRSRIFWSLTGPPPRMRRRARTLMKSGLTGRVALPR